MTEPESSEPGGADAPAPARRVGTSPTRPGRAGDGGNPAGGDRLQRGFERGLALAQLTVLLPVVVLLLSAVGAFIYGTVVVVHFVVDIVHEPFAVHNLRLFLTEIDLYLIGATLMIAAFGFYALFVAKAGDAGAERPLPLPAWLEMNDLNDLKARVISMIILVTAVTFTDIVLEFNETIDILYLGIGVAVFIAALTVYLRFGGGRD
ncbi:MAG TPA: YqhA family protein [Streptosporangiaceae bacterium]|nr:YqhA family protein [Streptosporangiaceae bacterium]